MFLVLFIFALIWLVLYILTLAVLLSIESYLDNRDKKNERARSEQSKIADTRPRPLSQQ